MGVEKRITAHASLLLLLMLGGALIFHLLVIFEVIPYSIVWGGRLQDAAQMRMLEAVSLAINGCLIAVVAMKGGHIRMRLPLAVVNGVLWLMVAVFALNTLGNLFALTTLETLLFTPLTLLGAVLCYRLARAELPRDSRLL